MSTDKKCEFLKTLKRDREEEETEDESQVDPDFT